MKIKIPAIYRFFAKTRYTDNLFEGSYCVEWIAFKYDGYGRFQYQGKPWYAHRWIYSYYHGEIPETNEAGERLVLNHLCSNRACVNVSHLELTTTAGNTLHENSSAVTKLNADKTCCPKCGGEYEVYILPDGSVQRRCYTCNREYCRQWRARNPEYMPQWRDKTRLSKP